MQTHARTFWLKWFGSLLEAVVTHLSMQLVQHSLWGKCKKNNNWNTCFSGKFRGATCIYRIVPGKRARVGAYMENVLKWFNYPHARAMGPNRLASSVWPWFVEASLTVEKAVSCYKEDRLVALLLHVSFHSIQSSLAVRECCSAGEECCERGHGWLCANLWCLMLWRLMWIRTIAAMWPSFRFTMRESSQNWGMGACLGQYDKYTLPNPYPLRKYCLHT